MPMSEGITQVIVPIDGSPAAAAATRHASLLARLLGAQLELLHVMPMNPAEFSDIPANRQVDADHDRAVRRRKAATAFIQARDIIDPALALSPREVTIEDSTFISHPERAIIAHAHQTPGSLLVLGARHLSDMGKFVRGSVSHEVVHMARCPVTIVHAEASMREASRIGRVLVPVDGAPACLEAATLAGNLARSAGVPVELIYCQRKSDPSPTTGSEGEDRAQRVLRLAREALGEIPAGVEEVLDQGSHIAEAIVAQATLHASDDPMIVMGRRGLSKWRESLLGSVSHRVIDLAPCPVTVVV